ncbi:MAG: hypothetical protein ABEL97_06450 [Salinibacter sp.]
MSYRRPFAWGLVLALGVLCLPACEPYMSMTDSVPSRTRRAAALLPDAPQFVGMVDVETALQQIEGLGGGGLVDSLRQSDNPYLRSFLAATDLNLRADVAAVYGATTGAGPPSAVVFGDLTAEQMDRYLAQAPPDAGRSTTYRDVPLYHLALAPDAPDAGDTLSVAFVGEGTMAVARTPEQVTAMVDRHRAAQGGLRSNDAYMALLKRVGRGSTAWLVGRNVVETALRDSAEQDSTVREGAGQEGPVRDSAAGTSPLGGEGRSMTQAGVKGVLAEWADRVLGLSEVSALEGRADERFGRLARRLREQALSIRLTDTALEGEAYLTMRDEASASSVVDLAEGAVAVLKLSRDGLDERHRNLLDNVEIDRDGAIVHVRFSLKRSLLREQVPDGRRAAARRADPSIHPVTSTIRRSRSITRGAAALEGATFSTVGMSASTQRR